MLVCLQRWISSTLLSSILLTDTYEYICGIEYAIITNVSMYNSIPGSDERLTKIIFVVKQSRIGVHISKHIPSRFSIELRSGKHTENSRPSTTRSVK